MVRGKRAIEEGEEKRERGKGLERVRGDVGAGNIAWYEGRRKGEIKG